MHYAYSTPNNELLEHPAEYLYPTSDKAPALSRDNLEDIFLTPMHVRLFNLCMPKVTDFTQTRRVLDDKKLQIDDDDGDSSSAALELMLDAQQVTAFSDRPLDLPLASASQLRKREASGGGSSSGARPGGECERDAPV